MTTTLKPRQPRLRASCDGCFTAKVKCSKERPTCSRCLSCNIDCRYSPSCRAGKSRSEPTLSRKFSMPEFHAIAPVVASASDMPHWQQQGNPLKRTMRRQASMMQLGSNNHREFDMPWTPLYDVRSPFNDFPITSPPITMDHSSIHQPAHPTQMPIDLGISPPWTTSTPEFMGYMLNPAGFTPTPSMGSTITTPTSPPSPPQSACACFQTCLGTLNSLHEAPSPPFSQMTKLNAQAVEACFALLGCAACMARSDRDTLTMTMAVLMLRITTLYRDAIPLAGLGIVNPSGDRHQWMELQILATELARLQQLYHRFSDACTGAAAHRPADGMLDLGSVMAGHLGQVLSSTIEAVRHSNMGSEAIAGLFFQ